ncbi:MAG: AAA family ATPase [Candidatus Kuenenia sp.]|nr:AAA family ATPase [Candidatus Kuenenia hertensis]
MNQKNKFIAMPDPILFQNQVHLSDYLKILKKRKWIIIIFFLAVVSIVTAKSFHDTPVYQATAKVIIENRSSFMEEMADVSKIDSHDESYLMTQYNLLQSRSLAKKVIEEQHLLKEFMIRQEESDTTNKGTQDEVLESSDSLEENINPAIVDWYLSKISVVPLRGTNLVNVSFMNSSPELAVRIANAHVKAFIERSNELQQETSQKALDWIKEQIRSQKNKVILSQREMYEYKYEKLATFSIDNDEAFTIPELADNPVINDLRAKLAEINAWKMEKASKYGPNHPRMVEAVNGIHKLEEGIMSEVQKIRMAIKNELDLILAVEGFIPQGQVAQQQVASDNTKAMNYTMAQLETESDQEIYDILLKQAKEIGLTGNMERNNIRVVDAAEKPYFPVKPKIFFNVLLAIVLGAAFGSGFAFFLEYMDKKVRTPEDILKHQSVPVLGTVPYDKSLNGRNASLLPLNDPVPEETIRSGAYPYYNDISGSFLHRLPIMQIGNTTGHIIIIESTTVGEGKTTFLAKTAINLANMGLRVIMLDADLQRPSLHNLLWGKNEKTSGLTNAVSAILSKNIREGSLSDCSVDDLFSLIAIKKQSGKLTITHDSHSMSMNFANGRFFHIQSQDNLFANRLGAMLLRGGFIDESKLEDALERCKRTGFPLGYVLVNAGYVTRDQLQGPLKLQIEEHLQKIFSWKQGDYKFEHGAIEVYEDNRLHYDDDFNPVINRLGRIGGSRLLEGVLMSNVTQVDGSNVSLIPAGTNEKIVKGPAYFQLMEKFFHYLKRRYDVVLVDAPPIMESVGSMTPFLSLSDGVIFVIKCGHVSHEQVAQALAYVRESKANIIGTVLNQVKDGNGYYYKS